MTALEIRCEIVMSSWAGTPYVHGQASRGQGVDCVRFVDAVLQELYGWTLPPLPRLPQDTSVHSRGASLAAMSAFLRRYPHELTTQPVEAGDVIVLRRGQGPGHALIASVPPALWHSISPGGVCRTSLAAQALPVEKVFRPLDKGSWLR